MPPVLPIRPEISLIAILGYAFFAFATGLALTPWFIDFLRRNRLGKQLRVETVDGHEATIFRKYHEQKSGTPTMGGILIWGSIVLTILMSRGLSFFGVVENSLLQRGQVYLPLFMLLSLGILGAIDDYLNVVGSNEEQWKKIARPVRWFFFIMTAVIAVLLIAYFAMGHSLQTLPTITLPPPFVVVVLYILSLAYIGASVMVIDDWVKHRKDLPYKKGGLAVLPKITALLVLSFIAAAWFYFRLEYNSIDIPFIGSIVIGWWYIPLAIFLIVGTANAVNVTDGLDGLAGGLLVLSFGSFALFSYLGELFVLAAFCATVAGAIAAFLWHNVPPALFYMGDTGALALGGTLAVIALLIDHVLILPFIGFVFVIETLSVLIQLASKKLRGGKKVFKAAPIHHHFEALDWGESKVTMRLWIIGAFFAFLGVILSIAG